MLVFFKFIFVNLFSSSFYKPIFHDNLIDTSKPTPPYLINNTIIFLKRSSLHLNKLIPLNLNNIKLPILRLPLPTLFSSISPTTSITNTNLIQHFRYLQLPSISNIPRYNL